jgi:hypothetical protein
MSGIVGTELIAAMGNATRFFEDATDAFDDAARALMGITAPISNA